MALTIAAHPLTEQAHRLATAFLAARRAQHGDLIRMEDAGDGADGGQDAGDQGQDGTGTDTGPDADLAAEIAKWKAMARKHEAASKANADKAKQFDELQESQKTELQKAADRAAAAEARAAEVEARAMRAEVAAAKGVPANLLSGTTQEELEASADALLAFRGATTRSATSEEVGAGRQGDDVSQPKQLTREDLKSMSAQQILAAQKAGQLAALTKGA